MSHVLSELLGISELRLSASINRLEIESGHSNVDVHLISDLAATLRHKLKELGLDPHDTTGRELYHALRMLIEKHDEFLVKAIGANGAKTVNEVLPKIKHAVNSLELPSECWALKPSVAKKLLKAHPPKRVMRQLNYKSIDSMLKRERIIAIFAAARISESNAWQERFNKAYKDLNPNDFENRPIQVLLIRNPLWHDVSKEFVKKKRHNIAVLNDIGVVLMLPMPVDNLPGATITIMSMLIRSINELRSIGAYLKLQQVKPNFGAVVAKTLQKGSSTPLTLAGQGFSWRVIQQYSYDRKTQDQTAIFGPHIQAEDLAWIKPEDVLYRIEPALKFWQNMSFVAARHDKRPISFNLLDNAISLCNQLTYGNQSASHFRENLKGELYLRYLKETPLGEQAFEKLESTLVGANEFQLEVNA